MEVLLAFLGWFFGAISTIVITIWVESLRSPSLKLSFDEPPLEISPRGPFKKRWRSLRIKVLNERLSPWAKWLSRLPAQQCRAEIAFLRADGTAFLDKPMTGRWPNTPEPLVVHLASANGQVVPVLTNPQELKPTVDVYAGETALLDVAVRVDGEDDCYCWNDETYFYQNWRNPNRQLGKRIYLIEVTVTSSGKKCRDYFRLANDGPFAAFCLAQPTPLERQVVKARAQA